MIRGTLLILAAEFSFALSTVFTKFVTTGSAIPAIELTFFRFLAGFIGVALFVLHTGKSIRPKNVPFITLRAVFNTAAVLFFFLGIQYTTVSKANMLNMTYPVFVFLIAPLMTKERLAPRGFLFLLLSMAGMVLVMLPAGGIVGIADINRGDLFSLLSGVFAAVAITSLRQARKSDETHVILFYLMLFGAAINAIPMIALFVTPRGVMIPLVIAATIASVAGQVFITAGYRYIEAAAGALVSSSRIIFGLLLGVSIFADPLTLRIGAGALLILVSLPGVNRIGARDAVEHKVS